MSKSVKSIKSLAQKADNKRPKPTKAGANKKIAVDIVTGKEEVTVFFDPAKVLSSDLANRDADWIGLNYYAPAAIIKEEGGILTVRLPGGELTKLTEATKVTTDDDEGVDDILKLRDFSEMSLVHTLRVRYSRDDIYTNVGPILISLNPYKIIDGLYDETTTELYHARKLGELPPHLFAVAEACYRALMEGIASNKTKSQSIIISGESGSGKTEATKVMMRYLAFIAAAQSRRLESFFEVDGNEEHAHIGQLEQKVLNSNPILEAFGNARTLRNDNSSRFGKFIKIHFSTNGRIVGATIEKYLLEKTRLVRQIEGERNFHIFYQLLKGSDDSFLGYLGLERSIDSYLYLSGTKLSSDIPNVSDKEEWRRTAECLNSITDDESIQTGIFRLLASILHLGNISFQKLDVEDNAHDVTPDSAKALSAMAELLRLDPADIVTSLTKQNMYVNGNVIVKSQTVDQALDKKNSLAKSIYSLLFSWLVDKINYTINPSDKLTSGFIGLLDIYGFENFENLNSFEQLLINYANEKMQNHFNKHIFQIEQAEYQLEGIDWSYIDFKDNLACIELIDGKPQGKAGIFQTLDDSSSNIRQDSNSGFLTAINMSFSGSTNAPRHANYVCPRFNSDQRFGILHYAGEVFYEIEGFVEKNREAMNNDLKDLLSKSENALLKIIWNDFAANEAANQAATNSAAANTASSSNNSSKLVRKPSINQMGGANGASAKVPPRASFVSKLKEDSVSKQFVGSMKQLESILETTEPHFIRCIKPNCFKQGNLFNGIETLIQLKYSGMLETIRIRQQGYALRIEHKDFFQKFSCLNPSSRTLKELVEHLSRLFSVSDESWQVGATKIFLRRELSDKLDQLLWLRWCLSVRVLQRFFVKILKRKKATHLQAVIRGFAARSRFRKLRRSVVLIQSLCRRLKCVRLFRAQLQNVVAIQSVMRGKLARIRVRKNMNPYCKLGYDELTVHLLRMHQELATAFAERQFELCAHLEQSISLILEVRESIGLPLRSPESREDVELFYLEVKFALDYYARKDSKYAEQLVSLLTRLENLRSQFPTVEEVSQSIETVQADLKKAMDSKQFKVCSELQNKLLLLEKQLNDLKQKNKAGNLTVEELKARKASLESDLSAALLAKQFDACSNIQLELDGVEALLSEKALTESEVAAKIVRLTADFENCLKTTDFLEMAKLHIHIESLRHLQSKPGNESSDKIVEEVKEPAKEATAASVPEAEEKQWTRKELLKLIDEHEAKIAAAVKQKQYQLCEQLNSELETLQIALSKLPSKADLKKQLLQLEKDSKDALSKKQYLLCDEIEKKIDEVKALLLTVEDSDDEVEQKKEIPPRPSATIAAAPQTSTVASRPKVASAGEQAPKAKTIPSGNAPSVYTSISTRTTATRKPTAENTETEPSRSVMKLRPKVPITALDSSTILEVASKMALNRVDAALLLGPDGSLSGIITDNDITRKVVSQFIDPNTITVDQVMTRNPKCVHVDDSALDALELMVDNHFRHLPVLDNNGVVVGLLDIAKCLYDAISILEKVDEQEGDGGDKSAAALAQMMTAALQTGGRNAKKGQMLAMQAFMEQMFGGSVPTLRKILSSQDFHSVVEGCTVRDAAQIMARARKGILVLGGRKGKDLVGILTPKDLLSRVVAKRLDADSTLVSEVMTPNPDCVSADLTLLDALKEMHDHKYLHLPVKDEGLDGKVMGLVDVMDLLCHSAGGEGQGKGWRAFFKSAMVARGDGDGISDTGSERSHSASTVRSKGLANNPGKSNAVSKTASAGEEKKAKELERPVSKLRPKVPITALDSSTILEVASKMALNRVDAALLLGPDGSLSGIITDNDITRKVVSQFIDPNTITVDQVMTRNPKCVHVDDSALDALELMVDNHFRHLPVLDNSGVVVGLLDIAKCLYDAISILEKVDEQEGDGGDKSAAALAQMMTAALQTGGRNAKKGQMLAMQAFMEQMFGGSVPTLRKILSSQDFHSVVEGCTVRDAAQIMARARKGILVLGGRKGKDLVGILTPKDLLSRVVAKRLDADSTLVSEVMTPNPDCVSADLTLLDALKEMHDHKYLHLPVKDEGLDGKVMGLVDVMDLLCHSAGGEGQGKGWRAFFKSAMVARGDGDGISDTGSERSHSASTVRSKGLANNPGKSNAVSKTASAGEEKKAKELERPVSKLRPKVPITALDSSTILEVASKMALNRVDAALLLGPDGSLSGIITDNDITRKVVSQFIDPNTITVDQVMTRNPKCVHVDDSALDALELMVDNHFRHLPVLDNSGVVVGLLDIAKCLYDAISILEKVDEQEGDGGDKSAAALAQMMTAALQTGGRNAKKGQMLAMQAFMEQMFGGSVPTLRKILSSQDFHSVVEGCTVRDAAQIMARARKGILVLGGRKGKDLVGILTPKDLLSRVVAKRLDADSTLVSEVMTPNPDCVSADLTLLDALKEMHDHKYLHLPVKDEGLDGKVMGLVDVMDLLCHSAGGEGQGKGWRAFFKSAMVARGDGDGISDTGSERSHSASTVRSKGLANNPGKSNAVSKTASAGEEKKAKELERPVSKLRPKVPITALDSSTILEVASKMALNRVDAALLLGPDGSLSGIITDNDITRKVVSQFIDPNTITVDQVMTRNPKCVHVDDSALDALELMVDNHFRHLPVLDNNGVVVGLLDIAKCLYDAISILEKVDEQEGDGGDKSAAALAQMMTAALQTGGRNAKKGQMLAMQAFMEQMFGGSVPTLRKILSSQDFHSVVEGCTVRDAAQIMARARKGILVLGGRKGKDLVGILTPKDLLSRVVAKRLDADSTLVSEVMTPNPDCVSADLTLLDALKEMHDHKYLHLPVKDEGLDGKVMGLVDVMDLLCHSAGGEGQGKGWRAFFKSAMVARGDGDGISDTGSERSHSASTVRSKGLANNPGKSNAVSKTASAGEEKKAKELERPVSKLRPKVPITALDSSTILEVASKMALNRVDAALLLGPDGSLSGIITDNDITRKVVSQFIDPNTITVDQVMTRNPKCVHVDDSALDALELMVDNHFRHLPVLDNNGVVVGLLDIAKCLYDAISILEKVDEQEGDGGDKSAAALAQMMTAALQTGGRNAKKGQMLAMQAFMEQMFGGSVPTLRKILDGAVLPSIRESANVREASCLMVKYRKGLLVLGADEEVVGIVTPKDLLMRVVSKNRPADLTAVSSIMTPNPDCVSADLTLLDALKEMHDHKYLHLPVKDEGLDGKVMGLVDVMDLLCHSAGGEGQGKGWRAFFKSAMVARGDGDSVSDIKSHSDSFVGSHQPSLIRAKYALEMNSERLSIHSPDDFTIQSNAKRELFATEYDFKVTDKDGNIHKVRCVPKSLADLRAAVAEVLKCPVDNTLIKYVDEDKDEVMLNNDQNLHDAVLAAKAMGLYALKIVAVSNIASESVKAPLPSDTPPPAPTSSGSSSWLILGGAAAAGLLGLAAFVFARKR